MNSLRAAALIAAVTFFILLASMNLSACSNAGAKREAPEPPFRVVSMAAESAARELDRQISTIMPPTSWDMVVATPASLENLERASPLARTFAEELSASLVRLGYGVQESRRARSLLIDEKGGEFILTRDAARLQTREARAHLVLAGTYTALPGGVRFHLRLINAANSDVLAAVSQDVPMARGTRETAALTAETARTDAGGAVRPTVETRLNP